VKAVQHVGVDVTFLRMDKPVLGMVPGLPAGAVVTHVPQCSVAYYRYLYDTIGQDYCWWLRRTLSEPELKRVLEARGTEIYVLTAKGEPAGFYELDRNHAPLVNLAYFGLMPWALGHGLGYALLHNAIFTAWQGHCAALTVNTCTADHPRALPNYLKAGFRKLRTVAEEWPVPVSLGLRVPKHLLLG
jgi:GNAT superfamily N-acetyltransferase